MLEKLFLVFLGWEVDTKIEFCAIDVVLRPVTKAYLEECQTLVVGVTLGKVGIELLSKALQLSVAPVGIVCRTVATRIFCIGLLIVTTIFNILWYCRSSLRSTLDIVTAGIFVAETCYELVTSACHIGKFVVKPSPVVDDVTLLVASFYHHARQTIRELQGDRTAIGAVYVCSHLRPQYQTRHGLRVSNFPVNVYGSPFFAVCSHSSNTNQKACHQFLCNHNSCILIDLYIIIVIGSGYPFFFLLLQR